FAEVRCHPFADGGRRGVLPEGFVARPCIEEPPHGFSAFGVARRRRAGIAQVRFVFDGLDVRIELGARILQLRGATRGIEEIAHYHQA
ncbi:hypothetical protein, partial [Salmonella enterica]|uniref:hypothetical protein n=1 Tax=Salmonella enterica TaxID=28901 RepID=UPI003299AA72